MRTLELSHNDRRQSHKLILNINLVHTMDKRGGNKIISLLQKTKNYCDYKIRKCKLNLPIRHVYITTKGKHTITQFTL